MKIVEINTFHNGSTGNIMMQIASRARESHMEVLTFSTVPFSVSGPQKKVRLPDHHYFGSFFGNGLHYALAQLTDGNGFHSRAATYRLTRKLRKYGPDIIHLHNIHTFCINLEILFRYIRKNRVKVIWTFHDCWAFTGHCAHFEMAGCDRWKEGCGSCPQYNDDPKSRVDRSAAIWAKKKKILGEGLDLTIVTPSAWLSRLSKQSFLKAYPTYVIHNGIDLGVFRRRPSGFREAYGLQDKYIVLAVASDWGKRKGLDVLAELSGRLDDPYRIVVVGTNQNTDRELPDGIISIHRVDNAEKLAEIYSAADVFVNPTREDTFPTVNLEALACGAPVVTFDAGGSSETIDETCGIVVKKEDVGGMAEAVSRICENHIITHDSCIAYARKFDRNLCFDSYVSLYRKTGRPQ